MFAEGLWVIDPVVKMEIPTSVSRAFVGGLALCSVMFLGWTYYKAAENLAGIRSDIGNLTELIRIEAPADGGNRRLDVRLFMIRSQIAQAKNPIILIGDSITEAAQLPSSVCGHDIINAGIGGMTAQSYLPLAPQLLPDHAELIVVALGTNNSTKMMSGSADFTRLLDLLAKRAAKIVIAGIPPFDMSGALARSYFNEDLGSRNDARIRQIAEARRLAFVDLRSAMAGENLTVDGIHLNAAGYRLWRDAVLSHIRSSLGCHED